MTLINIHKRALLVVALALALLVVCLVSGSSSVSVSNINSGDWTKLFDSNVVDDVNGKAGDDNPEGFLGDTTEIDPAEERPKTNSDDPDFENPSEADAPRVDNKDNSGPVTIPERPYPDTVPSPDKKLVKPLLFRVYSHNIKQAKGNKLSKGELPWDQRRHDVYASIKLHAAANSIIMLQEAHEFQLEFVMKQLNLFSAEDDLEWVSLGGGRIDGGAEGEQVPIIFRQKEWQVVFHDLFWLNDNQRTSVTGWDGKYPRICTYATLKHRETGAYVNIFNTHLDHKGLLARVESAKILLDKMAHINNWPSILTGDLNATPGDDCYSVFSESLNDVHRLTSRYSRYGHTEFTVTGFQGFRGQKGQRIDYIFAPKYTKRLSEEKCDEGLPVYMQLEGYAILHSKFGGRYMSDHRPILADFKLGSCKA